MIRFSLVPRRRQVARGKLGSTCRPLPRSLSLVAHCHPVQLPAKRPCELLSLAYPLLRALEADQNAATLYPRNTWDAPPPFSRHSCASRDRAVGALKIERSEK